MGHNDPSMYVPVSGKAKPVWVLQSQLYRSDHFIIGPHRRKLCLPRTTSACTMTTTSDIVRFAVKHMSDVTCAESPSLPHPRHLSFFTHRSPSRTTSPVPSSSPTVRTTAAIGSPISAAIWSR